MDLTYFRQTLTKPDHRFAEILNFIESHYQFTPTAFTNADVSNIQGQNEGSCKVLALAILEGFTDQEALLAFGEFYHDVKASPNGQDHQNIRALQKNGLKSVRFDTFPLLRLNPN